MAAPTGQRGSHAAEPTGFEGFPFAVPGKSSEERASKEQEQTGEIKKKPCRACTDFKSWMKVQKKQSAGVTQVSALARGCLSDSFQYFKLAVLRRVGNSLCFQFNGV